MTQTIEEVVARVLAELRNDGLVPSTQQPTAGARRDDEGGLIIDLPDPDGELYRRAIGVQDPVDPDGLKNLCAATSARLGVGRAGPRPLTGSLLLFKADHGVTQDAIHGVVSPEIRDQFGLFTVDTRVEDRTEYLLRPDWGRLLSDEAKATIKEKCVQAPDVQICVGDGLSAAAPRRS